MSLTAIESFTSYLPYGVCVNSDTQMIFLGKITYEDLTHFNLMLLQVNGLKIRIRLELPSLLDTSVNVILSNQVIYERKDKATFLYTYLPTLSIVAIDSAIDELFKESAKYILKYTNLQITKNINNVL